MEWRRRVICARGRKHTAPERRPAIVARSVGQRPPCRSIVRAWQPRAMWSQGPVREAWISRANTNHRYHAREKEHEGDALQVSAPIG